MAPLRTRIRRLERRPRPPAPRPDPDPRLVARYARARDAASPAAASLLHDLHAIGDRAGFDALVDRLVAGEAVEVPAVDWTAEMRSLYYGDVAPAVALGVDPDALRARLAEREAAHARHDQGAVRVAAAHVRLLLRAAALGRPGLASCERASDPLPTPEPP